MNGRPIGILIAGIGTFLLMRKLGWSWESLFTSWEFLLILLGVCLILFAMNRPNRSHLLVWGGVVAGLGIHAWGIAHMDGWPRHWSLIPAVVGLSFFLWGGLYLKNRNQGMIGMILILLGLFAWPGIVDLPIIGQVGDTLHKYWPTALIVLGLLLMTKK